MNDWGSENIYNFVLSNISNNVSDILIRYSGKELDFDLKFAVLQISLRRKANKKLPSFLKFDKFLFPDIISSEQASDEKVARFHSQIIGSGKNVVDLTSGLGIDALTIARNGNSVTAIELDERKARILKHNSCILSIPEFNVICSDCRDWLRANNDIPDYYFIDPARRDSCNRRTHSLMDCLPDITLFYTDLIKDGSTLLIKASPLLDIDAIKKEIKNIKTIYIVSIKGEVKEVLIEVSTHDTSGRIVAVDLRDNGYEWIFDISEDSPYTTHKYIEHDYLKGSYGEMFLYEPGAAIMKLHASRYLVGRFPDLKKISPNTELYVSNTLYTNFPGRKTKIKGILTSKDLKKLKGKGFSVVARNFPMSADEIRKKTQIKEDAENFIYAMRVGVNEQPIIVRCEKSGI